MQLNMSILTNNKRNPFDNFIILDVEGNPVHMDDFTVEDLQEIIENVDNITLFGEEGETVEEIKLIADNFFNVLSTSERWEDGEVTTMKRENSFGAVIKRVKSTVIRGPEQINRLASMISDVLKGQSKKQ